MPEKNLARNDQAEIQDSHVETSEGKKASSVIESKKGINGPKSDSEEAISYKDQLSQDLVGFKNQKELYDPQKKCLQLIETGNQDSITPKVDDSTKGLGLTETIKKQEPKAILSWTKVVSEHRPNLTDPQLKGKELPMIQRKFEKGKKEKRPVSLEVQQSGSISSSRSQVERTDKHEETRPLKSEEVWITPKKTLKAHRQPKTHLGEGPTASYDSQPGEESARLISGSSTKVSSEALGNFVESNRLTNAESNSAVKEDDFQNSQTSEGEVVKGKKKRVNRSKKKGKSKKDGSKINNPTISVVEEWDEIELENLKDTVNPQEIAKSVNEKLLKKFLICSTKPETNVPESDTDFKSSLKDLISDFIRGNDTRNFLKLELKPEKFKQFYQCHISLNKIHDPNKSVKEVELPEKKVFEEEVRNLIEKIGVNLETSEKERRMEAFFIQYGRQIDSMKLVSETWQLSPFLKTMGKDLHIEDPWFTFTDIEESVASQIVKRFDKLNVSEMAELLRCFNTKNVVTRLEMARARSQQLEKQKSARFFEPKVLNMLTYQGLRADILVQLEVIFELTSSTIAWEVFNKQDSYQKYIEILALVTGIAKKKSDKPWEYREKLKNELDQRDWRSWQINQVLKEEPTLLSLVTSRLKVLLSKIKGEQSRTVNWVKKDNEGSSVRSPDVSIFLDEELASAFTGICINDLAFVKDLLKQVSNPQEQSKKSHQINTDLVWPERLSKMLGASNVERFKVYYGLLGIQTIGLE
ncbi:hypothetical protein CROQUDRAFT_108546 [Cronartium quercuum f. sp. fusiforme G11]|uniref:Uncharacterized protein n=1 Tax=Cronartium quercuum f. sp. fusiforme G11 TaxID=708437 RepID=A0A9P6NE42_9BASI|nr:hypothetical protein CROQUDRAFT_108546 [Cronartium quercuum f. sp. fusiforme G11]